MFDDFTAFKEELKSRIDIVDVVGEYVELKKRGSNYVGLCPFHAEKTPSFSVNRAGQFYHCFGCGKGGDVIGFLMDITGMSFMEAVEQLAERVGMEVPRTRVADGASRDQKERLEKANLAAAEYFHKTLYGENGKEAMDYLLGRGLSPEIIRTFRLGFAPEDPSGLVRFAGEKDTDSSALEAAGIISRGRYGGPPYSRFGGRVIFPIIDQVKRVIGFGGRLLEGEGAKYINSPDSLIYHKSRVLFGIHQAKDAIKRSRRAIVVEGYMDVIALHQAGIGNVIGASGTALTVEQGRIIARMARGVTLLFDGDSAGIAAAVRGADNLLPTGLDIGIVVLPEGHDPDSYVREHGGEALGNLLEDAVDLWEFKLGFLGKNAASVQDRYRLAGEIADSISLIPDEMKRDLYIKELSPRIGVDVNSMYKAVYGRIKRRARAGRADSPGETSRGTSNERMLLGHIMAFPGLARRFMEEAGSRPFTTPLMKKVADEVFHRLVEGLEISPSALIGSLDDRDAQELVAELAAMKVDEETASRFIEDNIRKHKKNEMRAEIGELGRMIEAEKNLGKKKELVARRNRLIELVKKLDTNHGRKGKE